MKKKTIIISGIAAVLVIGSVVFCFAVKGDSTQPAEVAQTVTEAVATPTIEIPEETSEEVSTEQVAEPKPEEVKPAETKPVEAQPVQTQPSGAQEEARKQAMALLAANGGATSAVNGEAGHVTSSSAGAGAVLE